MNRREFIQSIVALSGGLMAPSVIDAAVPEIQKEFDEITWNPYFCRARLYMADSDGKKWHEIKNVLSYEAVMGNSVASQNDQWPLSLTVELFSDGLRDCTDHEIIKWLFSQREVIVEMLIEMPYHIKPAQQWRMAPISFEMNPGSSMAFGRKRMSFLEVGK